MSGSFLNEEAMGFNHAHQRSEARRLANAGQANYDDFFGSAPDRDDDSGDDVISRHSSMELSEVGSSEAEYQETSPYARDVRNGFVAPDNTPPIRDFDPSGVPSTRSRPDFDSSMSRFPMRERLEPSAGALGTRRRENEVPIAIQDDPSTVSRNDGLYRSGIFPSPRPMSPDRMEAAASYRANLRPLLRQNRGIGSAMEGGAAAHRGRIASSSRWGRFKDAFRGSSVARRLFGLSTNEQVQKRRLNRRLEAQRLDSTHASGLFGDLSSMKIGGRQNRWTPQEKWGAPKYSAGPTIPEVDEETE